MDTQSILLIHVAVSLAALPLGLVAIRAMTAPTPPAWTGLFLVLAVLTTATGFLLPIPGLTPATITGILGTIVFLAMAVARFGFASSPVWQRVYVIGMAVSAWLIAFVTVAQAFLKVPVVNALAPTQTEWPFAATQIVVLLAFVLLGWQALRAAR